MSHVRAREDLMYLCSFFCLLQCAWTLPFRALLSRSKAAPRIANYVPTSAFYQRKNAAQILLVPHSRLFSLDSKLRLVPRLTLATAFQQYCCRSMRLVHTLESVSVLAVVSTGKPRVTTLVLLCLTTIDCNASELLDGTGLVTSHSGMPCLEWTSRASYCGTGCRSWCIKLHRRIISWALLSPFALVSLRDTEMNKWPMLWLLCLYSAGSLCQSVPFMLGYYWSLVSRSFSLMEKCALRNVFTRFYPDPGSCLLVSNNEKYAQSTCAPCHISVRLLC